MSSAFRSIIKELLESGGEGSLILLYNGGRRIVDDYLKDVKDVQTGIEKLNEIFAPLGIELVPSEKNLDIYVVRTSKNEVASAIKAGVPVCHMVAGALSALVELVEGRAYDCHEFLCMARGDPYCEFVVHPAEYVMKAGVTSPLTALAVMKLPKDLRKTAMAMIRLGEASPEEVAKVTNSSPAEEKERLRKLVRMGYLVEGVREGKSIFRLAR